MSRTKDLAKSSLSILASQGLTTIISIAFIAYFARVFSKEQMAFYALLSMMSGWTSTFGEMGMGTLAEKDVAQLTAEGKHEFVKEFISSVILYRVLVMVAVSIVLFWSSPVITLKLFGSNEYLLLTQYVVLISFFMAFSGVLGAVQVAGQRFVPRSVIDVVTVFTQRSCCVIGYLYGGIYGFFTGFLFGTLVGLFLCFRDVRRYLTFKIVPFRQIFDKSKGYFGLSLLRVGADQIDRPVVAFFLGAEVLAGYHVAKRLYDNLFGLVLIIAVPAGVKLGEIKVEGKKALSRYYNKIMVVSLHFFIPLAFFLMVEAKSLLLFYGGEKYISSTNVLVAFGMTLIGVMLWVIVRQAALRLVSVRKLSSQYVITFVVTLVSYVILLPMFGPVGIPFSLALGYLFGIVPVAIDLSKNWQLNIPAKELLSSLGCGLAIFIIGNTLSSMDPGVLHFSSVAVMSCMTYLVWLIFVAPVEARRLLMNTSAQIPVFRKIFAR